MGIRPTFAGRTAAPRGDIGHPHVHQPVRRHMTVRATVTARQVGATPCCALAPSGHLC